MFAGSTTGGRIGGNARPISIIIVNRSCESKRKTPDCRLGSTGPGLARRAADPAFGHAG